MRKYSFALLVIIVVVSSWLACKKPIHILPTPHGCGIMTGLEPTTMMLVFTNVNNPGDKDTAVWTDKTPNANTHQYDLSKAHLTLSANSNYQVQVLFYNIGIAVGAPGYDLTPMVKQEQTSHLICFSDSTNFYGNLATDLTWTWGDLDTSKNPLPIGLIDNFKTGADSASGLWKATLHHQYLIKNGDCAPGYIDVQALDTIFISPAKG